MRAPKNRRSDRRSHAQVMFVCVAAASALLLLLGLLSLLATITF